MESETPSVASQVDENISVNPSISLQNETCITSVGRLFQPFDRQVYPN